MTSPYKVDDLIILNKQGFRITGFFLISSVKHSYLVQSDPPVLYKLKDHTSNPGHNIQDYVFQHEDLRLISPDNPKYRCGQQVVYSSTSGRGVWVITSLQRDPLTGKIVYDIVTPKNVHIVKVAEDTLTLPDPEYPTTAAQIARILDPGYNHD